MKKGELLISMQLNVAPWRGQTLKKNA